jgi:hypothetical protein
VVNSIHPAPHSFMEKYQLHVGKRNIFQLWPVIFCISPTPVKIYGWPRGGWSRLLKTKRS